MSNSGPATAERAAEYAATVERVKAIVERDVPEGATVLVISKGDPRLVDFAGRRGAHFPQSPSGEYGGFHPATSADAITHLQALEAGGASHLVIPVTSAWWLDYYEEFRDHLRVAASVLVREDGVCIVYELPRVEDRPAWCPSPAPVSVRMCQLLDRLLPEDCTVVIMGWLDETPPELRRRTVVRLPDPGVSGGRWPVPVTRQLQHLVAGGAEFLVVPSTAYGWLAERVALRRHIEVRYPTLLHQRHVCTVFDLRGGCE